MSGKARTPKTPATKAAAEKKAVFDVLSPLRHDHEDFEPGDQVELTEAQASALPDYVIGPEGAWKEQQEREAAEAAAKAAQTQQDGPEQTEVAAA